MELQEIDPFWRMCFTALGRPGASELVANGPELFFVTHNGVKEKIDAPPMSLRGYIESIKANLVPLVESEQPFDENHGYIFEGHYKVPGAAGYEGRCHIALGPISETPLITMTKIAATKNTIESIAESGSMSTEMLQFLIMAAKHKLTIVLSGQSGAGKTTTLQALTKYFGEQDRIAIGEDLPELKLVQPNTFYLHTLPYKPGMDPNKVADLTFLVKQFLRMRPDRGIIGETRGKEFADFLVACNSGMAGSLTTLHANDPSGALDKMTRFALAGSDKQPIRSINKEIGTAIDLIVQLARINGKHRITHIEEITDTVGKSEDSKLASQPLYKYNAFGDHWLKENMMTDKLRDKLTLAGADIKPFLATGVGTILQKHAPRRGNQQPPEGTSPSSPSRPPGGSGNPFGRNI